MYTETYIVYVDGVAEVRYGDLMPGWQTFCKTVDEGAGDYAHCWDIPHVSCGPALPL